MVRHHASLVASPFKTLKQASFSTFQIWSVCVLCMRYVKYVRGAPVSCDIRHPRSGSVTVGAYLQVMKKCRDV